MLCPYCRNEDTKVIDKRDAGGLTKRRRECLKCERRFNTQEQLEEIQLRVIKKDGRREDFDNEKLKRGVLRACEKRPISTEKIELMLNRVVEKLRKKGKEVNAEFIGETVSKELKKVDKVAYIRFASVYKDFTDIDDFKLAIASLGPRELRKSSKSSRSFKKVIRGLIS